MAFLATATVAVLLVRSALAPASGTRPHEVGGLASAVRRAVVAPPPGQVRSVPRRFYVIRAGDTLDAVAIQFHTSVERLLALNPGVRPTSLRIGQRIRTA